LPELTLHDVIALAAPGTIHSITDPSKSFSGGTADLHSRHLQNRYSGRCL